MTEATLENLNLAVQLLFIGMLSVFLILAIVVGLGRLLISIVNRIDSKTSAEVSERSKGDISSKKIAAITAVVDIITQRRGRVKSIKKIS